MLLKIFNNFLKPKISRLDLRDLKRYTDTQNFEAVISSLKTTRGKLDFQFNNVNDANDQDPEPSNLALDVIYACTHQERQDQVIEILELLGKRGCNIKMQDVVGQTVAHYAAYRNLPKIYDYLLNTYPELADVKDNNGWTPQDELDYSQNVQKDYPEPELNENGFPVILEELEVA